MSGIVVAVHRNARHEFSKTSEHEIRLLTGIGVEGDAHAGKTVKHRSRVAQDPTQPNLRQVHLIHAELMDELNERGFRVGPGDMGENITTRNIELLTLSRGTLLHVGAQAILEVTGLRNPCAQLNNFQEGLMQAVLDRDEKGNLIRKAGIMTIVKQGGPVAPNDPVRIEPPAGPFTALDRV